jgi:hypothetical protein
MLPPAALPERRKSRQYRARPTAWFSVRGSRTVVPAGASPAADRVGVDVVMVIRGVVSDRELGLQLYTSPRIQESDHADQLPKWIH